MKISRREFRLPLGDVRRDLLYVRSVWDSALGGLQKNKERESVGDRDKRTGIPSTEGSVQITVQQRRDIQGDHGAD